jgi:hypothetical protein
LTHAYINGFLTEDDGTNVRAYDPATFGTDKAKSKLLWEGKPDKDGMVDFELDRALIGKQLKLTAAGGLSIYIDTTLPITRLGVFHTVFLQIDRVKEGAEHGKHLPLPPNWFVTSQNVVANLYRKAKYQNYLLTVFFIIATIGSPFIGLQIVELAGLAAGCVLSVVSLLLGNYASGFSRGL